MQAPTGEGADDSHVGYAEYYEPETGVQTRATRIFKVPRSGDNIGTPTHWMSKTHFPALFTAFIKETLCTMLIVVGAVAFVNQVTGTEVILKKFVVGLMFMLLSFLCYRLGNVPGLPRHCNLAVTGFEFLSGRVPVLNAVFIYLFGGFLGSALAGFILAYLPNIPTTSTISLIAPNQGTTTVGATFVVIVGSAIVTLFIGHLTSYLQSGSPVHHLRDRGMIAAVASGTTVAVTYVAYGVFNLDAWTYFGGCVAAQFHGVVNGTCWDQSGAIYTTAMAVPNPISGIAVMWMLAPLAGSVLAFGIDWLVVWLEHFGGAYDSARDKYYPAGSTKGAHVASEMSAPLAPNRATSVRRTPAAAATSAQINSKTW